MANLIQTGHTRRRAIICSSFFTISVLFAGAHADGQTDPLGAGKKMGVSAAMHSLSKGCWPADPIAFTASCYPGPAFAHVFTDAQMTKAYSNHGVGLIVGHGVEVSNREFHVAKHWVEAMPVFASTNTDLTGMSFTKLKSVLEGVITNWRQLGSQKDQKIRLYLHGGKLEKEKFIALMQHLDIRINQSGRALIKRLSDYSSLRKEAAADPGALVLGLRAVKPDGLKLIAVDNNYPFGEDSANYKVSLGIYVASRQGIEGDKLRMEYLKAVGSRNCIDRPLKAFDLPQKLGPVGE